MQLKVGASKVCIDPPESEYPFPSNFSLCDSKYDECHVRSIAINNGEKTILFLVYELSDLPGIDNLESRISAAVGVHEKDIIIACTHNHSSPCDRSKAGDFQEKFELFRKIELEAGIEAAKNAVESMRPAKCGFGTIDSYCNVNRDLKTSFGFWVEGPNYAGYSNKTLAVMKFVDNDGKLIAAMLNYGAHAVCAFAQKDVDGQVKTSGNFPGIACRFVEEYYGDDAVAVWTSGAAGNQDPILWDYQWFEYPDGYVTKISLPDGSGYVHMEAIGRQQGADAVKCLEGIKEYCEDGTVEYAKSTLSFPARMRSADSPKPGKFGFRMGGEGPRTDFSAPQMPALPILIPDPSRTIDFTLNVLRIGDVAVILTSGELYAEIARDMMEASPVKKSFVVTHIPGQGGYTLDKSSVDHKVFQAFGGVEPGSTDEPLANKTKELVEKVFGL